MKIQPIWILNFKFIGSESLIKLGVLSILIVLSVNIIS